VGRSPRVVVDPVVARCPSMRGRWSPRGQPWQRKALPDERLHPDREELGAILLDWGGVSDPPVQYRMGFLMIRLDRV
jgi:hypothetical protein